MKNDWTVLGSGSYNTAYLDKSKQNVFKIQHVSGAVADEPQRSVRVWNEMNYRPDAHDTPLARPATLLSSSLGNGWVCPYIEGRQSTDKEMARGLVELYNRTGRVIIDATANKNFITTPRGEVVCIDVGMALRLHQHENEPAERAILERKGSDISFETWSSSLSQNYQAFFDTCSRVYPETVRTVKALLYIQQNRPDIFNVNFLQENQRLKQHIADVYDYQKHQNDKVVVIRGKGQIRFQQPSKASYINPMLKNRVDVALRETRAPNLENIKESCITHIDRYINSRGKIRIDGMFDPNWVTRIVRNRRSTYNKVDLMVELRERLKSALSYRDMREVIASVLKDHKAVKSRFNSGLKRALNRSLLSITIGENKDSQLHHEKNYNVFIG